MTKIVKSAKIENLISRLKASKKSIILTGGCFDILHIGHIKFLKEAKKNGDILMVLLESDEKVKLVKGNNRPYFHQGERAEVLDALQMIDYVILLPPKMIDQDYDQLIMTIKPNMIAVTASDPILNKKKRQAELVGGKIIVIPFIKTFSSSRLAKFLGVE
ncbi:hypothetical protein A2960_00175 [Candidatus Gottesmanbacteria bacterium RIFCSPLOWO2_01_FULL_39_12b]|uniref:Cytidyltransferase-like domain-containing protein n=1 Tax=Candidatus Gottesmanbacteria bacterium RIFCSPLOWO2_01_FULL_39_12b TaxID=1798388 RepID=A0A1F6ASU3_9BACT|nr:MAG: hypothetical protein A2960_00175 [Candidatus Gottesmanbacteria bacterium RIFCSPLOWO2_01_FULL_39_12b]